MAVAVPILAGIGGGAAAAALGAGTALSVGTGIVTGAATASLMRQGSRGAPAAAAPTTETAAPTPPPTPTPPAPPPPPAGVDVDTGGAIRNVEALQGERPEGSETRVPGTGAGRQSTILTSGRGIMGDEGTRPGRTLSGGLLRPQRGMSAGLIA